MSSKIVYTGLLAHCATTVQEGALPSSPLCPSLQVLVSLTSYITVEALKELIKVSYITLDAISLCDMEGLLGAGRFL